MTGTILALCDGASPRASQTATAMALALASQAGTVPAAAFANASEWEDRGWSHAWRLEPTDGRACAHALSTLIERGDFAAVVAGDTALGREILGRLAGNLQLPAAGRVLSANLQADGSLEIIRAVDEDRRSAKFRLETSPALILADPDASLSAPTGVVGRIRGEALTAPTWPAPALVSERRLAPSEIALPEADVVVAGGRGLGRDGFGVAAEVAALLGGVVGASRVAVDLGWAPRSAQVGMTGEVVQPRLYIAAGISGAVHHIFGMKDSGFVVAVNRDAGAPIFQFADAAVVADAREFLEALAAALERRSGAEVARQLAGAVA